MDALPTDKRLFSDFGPVSPEAWEARIKADLKGADYEKSLFRNTPESIRTRPFYTRADAGQAALPEVAPGQYPYLRGRQPEKNAWFNTPLIDTAQGSLIAVKQALAALAGGATALEFRITAPKNLRPLDLIDAIDLTQVPVQFTLTAGAAPFAGELMTALSESGTDTSQLLCQFFFCPLTASLSNPDLSVWEEQALPESPLQELLSVTVNGGAFHEMGASLVQELAFSLSVAVEYANRLTEQGLQPDEALQGATFRMGIGTNYFMEIAKLRALRLLWAAVVKAYGAPPETAATLWVQSVSSRWHQSLFDPHNNLLRATTEAMSAIIGGCDFLTLLPFDSELGRSSDFSNRIARNISTILKEESYFDKAIDPAAGSYYIETLTAELAEKAWALFQQVEQQGGFAKALGSGFISGQLETTRSAKEAALAKRKEHLVGTNQFANLKDQLPANLLQNPAEAIDHRASSRFDLLRLRTLVYEQQNPRPQVHLALLGPSSMRKVRADFVQEFFALAGFDAFRVDMKQEPENLQPLADASCIVLCAADEDYAAYTDTLTNSLKASGKCTLVLLAGNPALLPAGTPVTGLDGFVYLGADAVEVLTTVQMRLGIA